RRPVGRGGCPDRPCCPWRIAPGRRARRWAGKCLVGWGFSCCWLGSFTAPAGTAPIIPQRGKIGERRIAVRESLEGTFLRQVADRCDVGAESCLLTTLASLARIDAVAHEFSTNFHNVHTLPEVLPPLHCNQFFHTSSRPHRLAQGEDSMYWLFRLVGQSKRQPTSRHHSRSRLRIESLEDRCVPASVAHPTFTLLHHGGARPHSGSGSPSGLTPSVIRSAYGISGLSFGSVTADGSGPTIAIVAAYAPPTP